MVLDFIIKKRKLKELTNLIRARRNLERTNKAHLINSIFKQLMNKPSYPDFSFGGVEISSIQIKQYTLQKLFNATATNSLIQCIADKKVGQIFPFPKNLRKQLELNQIKIKKLHSEIFWRFKCLTHLGFSLIKIIKIYKFNNADIFKKRVSLDLYVHGVGKETIQISQNAEQLDNVLSFFKKRNKTNKIMVYTLGKKNIDLKTDACVVESPFFGYSLLEKLHIFSFFCILLFRSLWDLIFGSGYFAFMSHEILLKKLALTINNKYLAKEYVFSQSSISYFPAWLDALSERGSLVTLFFYSNNIMPWQKKGLKKEWHYIYNLLTWPNYLVMDKTFGKEIKKIALNSPQIEISEPISLMDNNDNKLEFSEYIAIFDITPVRLAALSNYGIFSVIYDDEFSERFFKTIVSAASEINQPLVVKQKRSKTVPTTKRYRSLINSLSNNPKIKFLHPDTSAKRVILNCKASISMPFSSTGVVAKSFYKPAIYFDPSGDFAKNQVASLKVDIISENEWEPYDGCDIH